MVDVHTAIAIIFIFILSVVLYRNRSKFQLGGFFPLLYFGMMRTTWGLKSMDWVGTKLRKPVQWLGYAGIVIGFLGMIFLVFALVSSTWNLFAMPDAPPGVAPVLPFEVKGGVKVPFVYWILSIFVIAFVHEFAHGIVARAHNLKVKSSGFAFLAVIFPIIPAAFVEPDEKQVAKRSASQQLSVFAAGPLANFLFAFMLIFAFGLTAIVPRSITEHTAIIDIPRLGDQIYDVKNYVISAVEPNSPAALAGIKSGDIITEINGVAPSNSEQVVELLNSLKPGQELTLVVNGELRQLILAQHPDDSTRGYMGIGLVGTTEVSPSALATYGAVGTQLRIFVIELISWLFILSIGIGLFNLIPLGPIDGGRMFKLVAEKMSSRMGLRVWKFVSYVMLTLVVVNLGFAFLR